MTTISAKSILRSRNVAGGGRSTLSTLLCHYPRFIHAELMTHRVFSRNAASSRAIPFGKQLAAIYDDPAMPIFWGSNQPGMQAGAEVDDPHKCKTIWNTSMLLAIEQAERLHAAGCHKQIVNRIIEPYTHIKVLISSTEWSNFIDLRVHEAAEPHMRMLAEAIQTELEEAPIQDLQPGEYHLPFGEGKIGDPEQIALSVGRCASTSYKTVDNFDMTLERATLLHDQFVHSRPQHASPLEHVAIADEYGFKHGDDSQSWLHESEHGNFHGFRQYRHAHELD